MAEIESNGHSTGTILSLPLELLFTIIKPLEPDDVALLAISCRKLRSSISSAVDSSNWLILDKSQRSILEEQRRRFLGHLVEGFPAYFVCLKCNALHKTADVLLPRRLSSRSVPSLSQNSELQCGSGFQPGQYIKKWPSKLDSVFDRVNSSYRLTRLHVQLAMHRHRRGAPYGLALESLSYAEITRSSLHSLTTALYVILGSSLAGYTYGRQFGLWVTATVVVEALLSMRLLCTFAHTSSSDANFG